MVVGVASGVAGQDWLGYRWELAIADSFMAGVTSYVVRAGACDLHWCESREAAEQWVAMATPSPLADAIAGWSAGRDCVALIEGGRVGRLARIPPRLWGSYDAMRVHVSDRELTVLSAKARALFPGDDAVFIRVRPGR